MQHPRSSASSLGGNWLHPGPLINPRQGWVTPVSHACEHLALLKALHQAEEGTGRAGGSSILKSPCVPGASTLYDLSFCNMNAAWKAGNRIKAKCLKFCRVTIVQISFNLPTLAMKWLTGPFYVSCFCISTHRCLTITAFKSWALVPRRSSPEQGHKKKVVQVGAQTMPKFKFIMYVCRLLHHMEVEGQTHGNTWTVVISQCWICLLNPSTMWCGMKYLITYPV